MKRSANRRRSPAAEQRKKQRREQLVKFLRLNTWLVLLAVLVLIALMYLGRVGGLTLIYAALSGGKKSAAKLPQERITIG